MSLRIFNKTFSISTLSVSPFPFSKKIDKTTCKRCQNITMEIRVAKRHDTETEILAQKQKDRYHT